MKEEEGLDTTIIEGLIAEIGPESMARVLDAMAGDAERLLIGLLKSLETRDAKGFSLYAHSLKSNSLTVGAVIVGAQFQELETLGMDGNLDGLAAKVVLASAAYRELIGFIVTVPDCDPTRLSSAG
jgi:HPt (histidine-containing phosphotransfer) domain-containing protein